METIVYPPTLEEIDKGINLSKSVVHRRLKALESKKYIKGLRNIPRSITILSLED
ncbi:LexA family protein [Wukongibacter baidiensis]